MQSLSFDDQRHFVVLLCFKASGLLDREFATPQTRDDVIRKSLGLDGKAWDEMRNRLTAIGIIDADLHPVNWDKRQFRSDHFDPTKAERMKKWREKKRLATLDVPETDARRTGDGCQSTETETETDKTKTKRVGARFTLTLLPDDWKTACKAIRKDLDPDVTFDRFRDYWIAQPGARGRRCDWLATWRNWCRNEKAPLGAKAPDPVKPWHKSQGGIRAKALEFGLTEDQFGGDWLTFRSAVYERAGVSA